MENEDIDGLDERVCGGEASRDPYRLRQSLHRPRQGYETTSSAAVIVTEMVLSDHLQELSRTALYVLMTGQPSIAGAIDRSLHTGVNVSIVILQGSQGDHLVIGDAVTVQQQKGASDLKQLKTCRQLLSGNR